MCELAPTFDRCGPPVVVAIHAFWLHKEHVKVAISFSLASGE
jgi:hypothetical protein